MTLLSVCLHGVMSTHCSLSRLIFQHVEETTLDISNYCLLSLTNLLYKSMRYLPVSRSITSPLIFLYVYNTPHTFIGIIVRTAVCEEGQSNVGENHDVLHCSFLVTSAALLLRKRNSSRRSKPCSCKAARHWHAIIVDSGRMLDVQL